MEIIEIYATKLNTRKFHTNTMDCDVLFLIHRSNYIDIIKPKQKITNIR